MTFLPAGYKTPDTGNYMRLNEGKNRFRILSKAIVGNEYWKTETNDEGKETRQPVRLKMDGDIPMGAIEDPNDLSHFWAFVVYNRDAERVQILEITQSTIRGAIKALTDDKEWGDPKGYDITINRTGKGFQDTQYTIMPGKPSEISADILQQYKDRKINLEALFENKDPFGDSQSQSPIGERSGTENVTDIDPDEVEMTKEDTKEEDVEIDDIPL